MCSLWQTEGKEVQWKETGLVIQPVSGRHMAWASVAFNLAFSIVYTLVSSRIMNAVVSEVVSKVIIPISNTSSIFK